MQNKKFDWITLLEELPSRIYVIVAICLLALNTVLCAFTPVDPVICGVITIVLYSAVSLTVYIIVRRRFAIFKKETTLSEQQSKNVIYTFRNNISLPYAVIDEKGCIITVNNAFRDALETADRLFEQNINDVCNIDLNNFIDAVTKKNDQLDTNDKEEFIDIPIKNVKKAEIAEFNKRKYRMEYYPLTAKGKNYSMIVFYDITELSALTTEYKNKHTVIGYIAIDNLEEIAQYVKVNYQDETRKIGKILNEWASKMGAVLCEYENNKFIIIFNFEKLGLCIKDKFSILSDIHGVEIGDAHIPLTISMGVASTGDTLEEREREAMIALDMALQRGGDQVVLKSHTGLFYFGAKTKVLQKRTRGHGKIIYATLASRIEKASNVLIMGHKNPDFDCIGACIGMSVLIRNSFKDKDVKIVIDTQNDNFVASTSRLMFFSEYQNMFIDGVSALDYNSSETLLIIVDANNLDILEAPELAKSSFNLAIIDHHIKKQEYEYEPVPCYIDPSASSACELIAEILEDTLPADANFKEEANIMLSGIMLDTKNFTRTVGIRTFAAAMYLKNMGADPEYARTFFEEALDDYLSEAHFGSKAKMYRDCIAIACETEATVGNLRVLAAKASDKLLTLKNVSAAFALVLVGEDVHISARSDGSINVQLIAERLGGGGHFDMAGVAIKQTTPEEAERRLKEAIDAYFEAQAEQKAE